MLSDILHVLAGLAIGGTFWGTFELVRWIVRRRRRMRANVLPDMVEVMRPGSPHPRASLDADSRRLLAKEVAAGRMTIEEAIDVRWPGVIQVEIPVSHPRPIFRAELPYNGRDTANDSATARSHERPKPH